MNDDLPRYLTVAICPGSGHHLECQCLDRAHAADSPIGCPNEVEVEFIQADLPARRTTRGRRMTPQCCTCHRFVKVRTAVEHIEWGDYGTVWSVEYECEACVRLHASRIEGT